MLVEDHEVIRAGLKSLLEHETEIQVIAMESTARAALAKLRLLTVDVVLVDISLPEENGIWLTREIRKVLPELPILMLTMHTDSPVVTESLEAGASGYLTKYATRAELLQALEVVKIGDSYIQPQIAGVVLQALRSRKPEGSPGVDSSRLSERELQVLTMVASGRRSQDIAEDLNLSLSTVKTHLRALYRKLEVNDRTQAVLKAMQLRLIAEPKIGASEK